MVVVSLSGVSFCPAAFEEEAHLVKLLVEAVSALLFHTINHYTFCLQKVARRKKKMNIMQQ